MQRCIVLTLNKLIYTFLLHFVQHSIWPLHFKFASYAYDVYLVLCKLLHSNAGVEGVMLCSGST